MVSAEQHGHLSDKEYWNDKYVGEIPRAVDPADKSLRNYFRRYQHRDFSRWAGGLR
jgi:hypothetical protein